MLRLPGRKDARIDLHDRSGNALETVGGSGGGEEHVGRNEAALTQRELRRGRLGRAIEEVLDHHDPILGVARQPIGREFRRPTIALGQHDRVWPGRGQHQAGRASPERIEARRLGETIGQGDGARGERRQPELFRESHDAAVEAYPEAKTIFGLVGGPPDQKSGAGEADMRF